MIHTLAIDWNFDPVAFQIFGLEIRYYGMMWALMILVSTKLFENFCKREGFPQSLTDSAFLYFTLATIIGSRVGHCLFYEPEVYLMRPWAIITEIRGGGMASHGAAVGLFIGMWLFSRKNKLPLVWIADRLLILVGISCAIVRLGNLFNSEIFGYPTDLPWAFRFLNSLKWQQEAAPLGCHPTQIYEGGLYLIVFIITLVQYYRFDMARRRPGVIFGTAMVGLFVSRFVVEFVKFDQVDFEAGMMLDMGQILSIPFILFGGWVLLRALRQPAVSDGELDRVAREANRDNKQKK